jgi:hypothetical protein
LQTKVKSTFVSPYVNSDNIATIYWARAAELILDDYESHYTAGGSYDPLIPGPPIDQVTTSGMDDFDHEFTMGWDTISGTTSSGSFSQNCELSLAGYPMEFHPFKYAFRFHALTGDEGDSQGAEWESTVISGSILDMSIDLYSTVTASGYYNTESNCGLVDLVSYAGEAQTVSGTMGYLDGNVLCVQTTMSGYGFDVDLLSLKISNFSLDIGEYSAASGTVCVDITDDIYNVVTSGTYFIIGETVTSGGLSFTPITDGYTMCYNSPTDFDSLLGATTVTVHAFNDNGDILEQDFYLTSGYIVEYNNRQQDYGFNSTVVVAGTAENLASCPATGADAYYFKSVPALGKDLGASIVGIPFKERDLSAVITPTTDTIYFYGKIMRIEIRAKDFAGNVMAPFTFEFKIEDEPEN